MIDANTIWDLSAVLFLISILTYIVPSFLLKLYSPQNLKKKYDLGPNSYALITGGSSGIGKAIAKKCLEQNINIVIVAYPDKLLKETEKEFKNDYPNLDIRCLGSDLSKSDFMNEVIDITDDIDIQCLFSNAGYIKTGFFNATTLEAQLANHNVNATASIYLVHHFVGLMKTKRLRGCVGFTSSPAGFMACPFSSMYGSTKAFITEFCISLAPEVKGDGIEVCVVHPSPIDSNFYEGTHALDALKFFKSTAAGPKVIADSLFSAFGRTTIRDQGYYPLMIKVLLKIIEVNFLSDIIWNVAENMGDFKAMKEQLKLDNEAIDVKNNRKSRSRSKSKN